MIHSNVHIQLKVIRRQTEVDNCRSIYFEYPIGFTFEAGDWIDIDFADTSYRGGKTYSLSSSPTESELAIAFRNGISPFKRQLQSVQPGDMMYITQYGNDYGFHLREHRSSVLIAGGIGIAPFRSMLKEQVDTGGKNSIQLLYFHKGEDLLFKNEIERWKQTLQLEVHYIQTSALKRKERQKIFTNVMLQDAHHYYIAGPEGMVEATEHLLIEMGISAKDIRIDSFGGYR